MSIEENFPYTIYHGYARFVLHALSKIEADKAIEIFPDNSLWINLGYCTLDNLELSLNGDMYRRLIHNAEAFREVKIANAPSKYTGLLNNILQMNDPEVLLI